MGHARRKGGLNSIQMFLAGNRKVNTDITITFPYVFLISYQDYAYVILIQLRQALNPYQDYHVLSLTLAGTQNAWPSTTGQSPKA